ncbi:MAG: hypothetical protein KDC05_17325, partial [Bacteroidales bacterium]|nr:hypothetical protein [Bacteroidales bacterium]
TPAPIYVLFKEGASSPVENQLNIVDVIPGDEGYNDFWQVHKVDVPSDYVANVVTSYQEIMDNGYTVTPMPTLVNCPVVPDGSTASLRYTDSESNELVRGWYKGMVVYYFSFFEKDLMTNAENPVVPLSGIYVTFNINPDQAGGGPPSGFMTESDGMQTHNVLQTIPEDGGYSPLWLVNIYDNADFDMVMDWNSATSANILAQGAATVNCPVVWTVETNNPNTAEKASIDRFSDDAGNLFMRSANPDLPGANVPIDFDQGPFITQGYSPDGTSVRYYNFDVMTTAPAPIYVLFREGEDSPVEGQLNIVDVIPGDDGYNDFWHVHKVTVPSGYVANMVSSYDEIMNMGYDIMPTETLVNCPVVPDGSTANLRYNNDESNELVRGWYKGKVVYYFSFFEKDLMVNPDNPAVPISDIYVTFNINPGEPGGGPPSGFVTETGSMQTHNVLQTLPESAAYSPLWDVNIYDNADFDMVMDWGTATSANILAMGAATVNCPVVWKQ